MRGTRLVLNELYVATGSTHFIRVIDGFFFLGTIMQEKLFHVRTFCVSLAEL